MSKNLGSLAEECQHDESELVVGSRVEIIAGPYQGQIGTIDITPKSVRKLRCWKVVLDGVKWPLHFFETDVRKTGK